MDPVFARTGVASWTCRRRTAAIGTPSSLTIVAVIACADVRVAMPRFAAPRLARMLRRTRRTIPLRPKLLATKGCGEHERSCKPAHA